MGIWSIWRRSNDKYWEKKDVPSSAVIHRASTFYNDGFITSLSPLFLTQLRYLELLPRATWSPPQVGYLKCNIDASLSSQLDRTGIGLHIRESAGRFMRARTTWFSPCIAIREGEASVLLAALHWISQLGLAHVILEMDNVQLWLMQVTNHLGTFQSLAVLLMNVLGFLLCSRS